MADTLQNRILQLFPHAYITEIHAMLDRLKDKFITLESMKEDRSCDSGIVTSFLESNEKYANLIVELQKHLKEISESFVPIIPKQASDSNSNVRKSESDASVERQTLTKMETPQEEEEKAPQTDNDTEISNLVSSHTSLNSENNELNEGVSSLSSSFTKSGSISIENNSSTQSIQKCVVRDSSNSTEDQLKKLPRRIRKAKQLKLQSNAKNAKVDISSSKSFDSNKSLPENLYSCKTRPFPLTFSEQSKSTGDVKKVTKVENLFFSSKSTEENSKNSEENNPINYSDESDENSEDSDDDLGSIYSCNPKEAGSIVEMKSKISDSSSKQTSKRAFQVASGDVLKKSKLFEKQVEPNTQSHVELKRSSTKKKHTKLTNGKDKGVTKNVETVNETQKSILNAKVVLETQEDLEQIKTLYSCETLPSAKQVPKEKCDNHEIEGNICADPSQLLFSDQQLLQIAVHKAAISKQLSCEENKRRKLSKSYAVEETSPDDEDVGESLIVGNLVLSTNNESKTSCSPSKVQGPKPFIAENKNKDADPKTAQVAVISTSQQPVKDNVVNTSHVAERVSRSSVQSKSAASKRRSLSASSYNEIFEGSLEQPTSNQESLSNKLDPPKDGNKTVVNGTDHISSSIFQKWKTMEKEAPHDSQTKHPIKKTLSVQNSVSKFSNAKSPQNINLHNKDLSLSTSFRSEKNIQVNSNFKILKSESLGVISDSDRNKVQKLSNVGAKWESVFNKPDVVISEKPWTKSNMATVKGQYVGKNKSTFTVEDNQTKPAISPVQKTKTFKPKKVSLTLTVEDQKQIREKINLNQKGTRIKDNFALISPKEYPSKVSDTTSPSKSPILTKTDFSQVSITSDVMGEITPSTIFSGSPLSAGSPVLSCHSPTGHPASTVSKLAQSIERSQTGAEAPSVTLRAPKPLQESIRASFEAIAVSSSTETQGSLPVSRDNVRKSIALFNNPESMIMKSEEPFDKPVSSLKPSKSCVFRHSVYEPNTNPTSASPNSYTFDLESSTERVARYEEIRRLAESGKLGLNNQEDKPLKKSKMARPHSIHLNLSEKRSAFTLNSGRTNAKGMKLIPHGQFEPMLTKDGAEEKKKKIESFFNLGSSASIANMYKKSASTSSISQLNSHRRSVSPDSTCSSSSDHIEQSSIKFVQGMRRDSWESLLRGTDYNSKMVDHLFSETLLKDLDDSDLLSHCSGRRRFSDISIDSYVSTPHTELSRSRTFGNRSDVMFKGFQNSHKTATSSAHYSYVEKPFMSKIKNANETSVHSHLKFNESNEYRNTEAKQSCFVGGTKSHGQTVFNPLAGTVDKPSAAKRNVSGPLFALSSSLSKSATGIKDMILSWCQGRTRGYKGVKIDNFSTSWNDGLAFCALIHHFYPDAFDFNALDAKNKRHNFSLAFRIADEKGGVYPLLDVEDMVRMEKPDWKCVFTYVQTLYKRFKDE